MNYFHPMTIGGLRLKNNLIAAPMAGLSSLPYRVFAIEHGCALSFSEMVSAEGIIRAHSRTRRYFANSADARPFGVQLFGGNPDAIGRAVSILEDEDIDLIDINMGCPVKKVCSKGAGAGLMRTPKIAAEIIGAARSATKRPLTVKMRSGWDGDSINCAEMARIAEDEGADAITIHPRTRQQGFKRRADWSLITKVKSAVDVPVIGNGDVASRQDAVRMIQETGCNGVMIGRAAVGNPWIFRQILEDTADLPPPSELGSTAIRHLGKLCDISGERTAILNMRTILGWYAKGMHGSKKFRQDVHGVGTLNELKEAITKFFS